MLSASYSSRREQEYSKLYLPQLRQSLLPFLISSNLVHAETAEKPHRMFLIFDKLFFLRKPQPYSLFGPAAN
jgi:hypothetical protein